MRWLLYLFSFFIGIQVFCIHEMISAEESLDAPYPVNPNQWVFARVQLRGTLLGKDKYRQYYLIKQGELFDMTKHRAGVEKIQEALTMEGYLTASVTDSLSYDPATHSLTVTLHFHQGSVFKVKHVALEVTSSDEAGQHDASSLKNKLQKLLQRELVGSVAKKDAFDAGAKKIHALLAQRGFFGAKIEIEKTIVPETRHARILFKIVLGHKHVYEFYGNLFLSNEQLLEHILLFGKSLVLIPPSLLAQELEKLYKDAGFWQVRINWTEDSPKTLFVIEEGPRVLIKKIIIKGAQSSYETTLQNFFKPVMQQKFFSEKAVQNTLQKITQWYLEQGYWESSIGEPEYIPCPELGEHAYQVIVPISEGKQRIVTEVVCEDPTLQLTPLELFGKKVTVPAPFNIHFLQLQRQSLLKRLQARGQLYAVPTPHFAEDMSDSSCIRVHVTWKIGGVSEPVTFGPLTIEGVTTLPESLLRRVVMFQEHETWDRKKIDTTVLNLKRLGVFDYVSLTADTTAPLALHKPLTLKIIQDTPYEARLRLGMQGVNYNIFDFNGGTSYKAGGSFLIKNITNHADQLQFNFDMSRFMRTASATYKIPWLFGAPIGTECKAYHSIDNQPVIQGYRDILYKSHQDGFLVSLHHKSGIMDWGLNNGIEWMGISDINQQTARDLLFDPVLINQRFPYWYLEPSLFLEYLDNKVEPRYGGITLLSCKAMVPFTLKDAAFFKILFEQSGFYTPFDGPITLAARFRCGSIFLSDFRRIIPIERFFLGGAFSLRGYEPDFAPPLNVFTNCNGEKRLAPTGGKSMVTANFEMRFPLYGPLGGVLFTDVGALSQEGLVALRARHALGAAGFGLRLNTPVGPLRFDIGWKLKQDAAVEGIHPLKRYAWFLTLGQAF